MTSSTPRTLRAVWVRRGPLALLLLTSLIVTSAGVVTVEFARASDTPLGLLVPLVVLGLVAVPGLGRDLALARRGEFALARLRGQASARVLRLALGETGLVLAVGVVVGVGVGQLLAVALDRLWLGSGQVSWRPDPLGLALAASVLVVGLIALRVGMHRTLNEPLGLQVRIAERPRRTGVLGLFGAIVVIVAAAVALYRAGTLPSPAGVVPSGSARSPSADPDWVVLAGPVIVGLAVGQLVLWAVHLLARAAVARTREGDLADYLAARRLARATDRTTPVRLLVAALTLAAAAITGARAIDAYADDTARQRQAAPLKFTMDTSAITALTTARALDPDGRWLMAAVTIPTEASSAQRRAFIDSARYDRVVGDFLSGTPAASLAGRVAKSLAPRHEPVLASGTTAAVRVSSRDPDAAGAVATVRLRYRDAQNLERVAVLVTALGDRPRQVRTDIDCAQGCGLVSVSIAQDGDATYPITLGTIDFGGVPVTDLGADVDNEFPGFGVAVAGVGRPVPGGDVRVPLVSPRLGSSDPARAPLSGIVTPGLADGGEVSSPGGLTHPLRAVADSETLPLVDGSGVLADLPSAERDDTGTVPAAEVAVLARADTPTDVVTRLRSAGAAAPITLEQTRDSVVSGSGAVRAWLFALVALACLALALMALVAAGLRQRGLAGRETAALRLLLVPRSARRAAVRRERLVLTAAVQTGVLVGAAVVGRWLLGVLPLLDPLPQSVAPALGVDWPTLLVVVAVTSPVVYWLLGRGLDAGGHLGDPGRLRERGAG